MTAVAFRDVGVSAGGQPILENVSFDVPRGGNTAIIGPNGAGKTTLVLALLGQERFSGTIAFSPAGKRPRTGYVPQRLAFDSGLPLTVREFVCLNWRRLPLWFGAGRKNRVRADALLDASGILYAAGRRLGDLSGGELRRALLALALGREPDLLVLDEPTAGVDYQGEMAFHKLLDDLRRDRGFTQMMVCHNLSAVLRHATRVVCLNRSVLAEGRPGAVLTEENLARTFMGSAAEYLPEARRENLRLREAGHA